MFIFRFMEQVSAFVHSLLNDAEDSIKEQNDITIRNMSNSVAKFIHLGTTLTNKGAFLQKLRPH